MRTTINIGMQHLKPFLEGLREKFAASGETLHSGRNTIKAFDIDGERFVIKKYKHPNAFNTLMYSFFRKSKARRAYEHALRLRSMGIDTPEPAAWVEYRRHGLLQESFFLSRYTNFTPLSETTKRYPEPDTEPVLAAFAHFTVTLHKKGIEHDDFNHTNILYRFDAQTGEYHFQLIDINRMKFRHRMSRRACMVNLRRLSCPAIPFLYILDKYSQERAWNTNDTILQGLFFRLLFRRRQHIKSEIRQHRLAHSGKKTA